jgi:hypothetical protein
MTPRPAIATVGTGPAGCLPPIPGSPEMADTLSSDFRALRPA